MPFVGVAREEVRFGNYVLKRGGAVKLSNMDLLLFPGCSEGGEFGIFLCEWNTVLFIGTSLIDLFMEGAKISNLN